MLIPRSPLMLGFLLLMALTCSLGFVDAKPDAELIVTRYFESRVSGDVDEALSLYADLFFEVTPRPEWQESLVMLDRKLGPPGDRTLTAWNVFVGAREAGAGTYVALEYDVEYAFYPAHESFRIFTPAWGWPASIISHHVNSPAFD